MATQAARFALAVLLTGAAAHAQTAKPADPAPAKPAAPQPAKPAPKPAAHGPAHGKPQAKPQAAKPAAPATPPAPLPAVVTAPEPEKPAEPAKGSSTGNPLPRFAALRSDEVNLRTGPGTRYPIEWVYKRRDLPVQIEREFDAWRLIRDQEGTKGWVHAATLTGRRTAEVVGGEHVLRYEARDDASPVAKLKPGVIIRLRSCPASSPWCQAQVGDYRGWIKRSEVWGIMPDEIIQ